jgi:hypothetical protein
MSKYYVPVKIKMNKYEKGARCPYSGGHTWCEVEPEPFMRYRCTINEDGICMGFLDDLCCPIKELDTIIKETK